MSKRRSGGNQPWRGAESLRDYTDHAIEAAAPAWRRCLRAFTTWLEEERDLELSSIVHRVASARQFVEAQEGSGGVRTLRSLSDTDVEDFFIGYAKDNGPAARRSMQGAMRLFLRFASSRRWVKHDLADAVPSLRSYGMSSVPRGLTNDEVRTLAVASAEGSARNHALILFFAVYGVRRGQICGLQLEDIDWRNKIVDFRPHKGGKPVRHELVPAVAADLARYLQHERPTVDEQAVFLRAHKPYLPLGPSGVSDVVRRALHRAGLSCTPCGPHVLRHAFATRLLQGGQPLKVIADLLGHRSLDAVSTYAKVNYPQLLKVAADWPEVTP